MAGDAIREAVRSELEKNMEFRKAKDKIIANFKDINDQVSNDEVKNLIENQILPNILALTEANHDAIIIQAIQDLMDDTLYDKNEYLVSKSKENLGKIIGDLLAVNNLLNTARTVTLGFQHLVKEYLGAAQADVSKELLGFRKNRASTDNAKTEDIYNDAVDKYRALENKYRTYFYRAITATVGLSLLGLFLKNWLVTNYLGNIEFWVLKASILAVGITLITYFLKQSAHYQRLADQSHQTQVELQAFPSFMESIPTEEAASVRKELALKYFGREIDGAAHKDMSNLISDQMKSTTEMVKAATDVLKVNGGK